MRIYLLICRCANQPLFTFVLTVLFIFTFMLSMFSFVRKNIYVSWWTRTVLNLLLICCCTYQPLLRQPTTYWPDVFVHYFYWFFIQSHHVLARCIVHYFYWFLHKSIQMYCASFYWFLHKIPPRIGQMYLCIIDFFIKCHDLIKILIPPFGDFLCIDFASPQ